MSLKTELSYKGPAAVNKPKMKTYIYDENGVEIERFERPPRRQEVSRGSYIEMPEMKSVKRGPTPGSTRMDDAWVSKADSLSTEVRVRGALPSKVTVSAYFFDASKRLVRARERPAMTNLGGGLYTAVPKVARKNEWYPVCFPFDAELKATGWQWAVVVFVADGQAAANLFGPRGVTLADFEFPGRELVLPAEAE